MIHLKTYNESIRDYHVVESIKDYLKPKSDDELVKSFKDMNTYNILKMSIDYNMKAGFKYLVDNDLICVNLKYLIEKYQMGLHQDEEKGYEKWFLKKLTNLEIFRSTENSDILIYKKDNDVLFNYNEKDKKFYIEYKNIHLALMSLSLVFTEIQILVQGMVEKYLNINVYKVGVAWIDYKHGKKLLIK